jgi:hypothetical protein
MQIKFQADADLNQKIVKATLRHEPSIDFQTALAAALPCLPDPEVLKIAAKDGRILVSHDQTTMPNHFAAFITTETSPGLIIAPQHLSIGLVVESLVLIWAVDDAEEWINRIRYLPL